MPIIDPQDAAEVEEQFKSIFAADRSHRAEELRKLFVEKLDFEPVSGSVNLGKAQKGVQLPGQAERLASMSGITAVYVHLTETQKVNKREAAAAAKLISEELSGDILLVMTNASASQVHFIYPTFERAKPSLRRLIVEGADYLRRTAIEQIAKFYGDWNSTKDIRGALERLYDVEAVTARFFREYKRVFDNMMEKIQGFGNGEEEAKKLFVQTLFNRLMFVYFLSRKGWLTFNGDKDYLNALWRDHLAQSEDKNFYNIRLRNLFFLGLNNEKSSKELAEAPGLEDLIGDPPFLNGGLFDEWDQDKNSGVVVPDEAVHIILDELFDQFNFTVMESTPLDVEVAVDPEMLGKVFEELVTGRHKSGSYYTPRPVVSFMCREALKGYLEGKNTGADADAIRSFVDDHDSSVLSMSAAPRVGAALAEVTVVDPACGSGAYLLGMLQELVDLQTVLYSDQLAHQAKDVYALKLQIIQDNLYGADIDEFAKNIAMLRIWLSLAIEYDGPVNDLKPLPNLEFKIVCGDSLTGPDPSPEHFGDLFGHRIHELAGEIAQLKQKHMRATGSEKFRLVEEIESLQANLRETSNLTVGLEEAIDWRVEFAEVFDQKGGFDIVVANPPYINAIEYRRTHSNEQRSHLNSSFHTARGAYDLYVLFFERAIQLLRKRGLLSFITPNKFLAAPYATALRAFLRVTSSFHMLVNLSRVPVFASSQVYPVLSFFIKDNDDNKGVVLLLPPLEGSAEFSPDTYRALSVEVDALDLLPDHLWGFLLSDGYPYLRKLIKGAERLDSLAQVSATTTAAEAEEYGRCLKEGEGNDFKVVNTGTIQPFRSVWGGKKLRDHGASYLRPYLSPNEVSDRRRVMYSTPKLIFAKIARSCEAMLDERGEYAGLNVNCVYSPRIGISLEYLTACVHSFVFRYLYQELFGSLRMAGGYLQFQAPQLRAVPILVPDDQTQNAIILLVRQIIIALDNGESPSGVTVREAMDQIDELIVNLYKLSTHDAEFIKGRVKVET